jgi:hypothetical protein
LAFKRHFRIDLTNDYADSSTLVKKIGEMKAAGKWKAFESKYVDQALAELEKDVDRRLQEAFRNLLPSDLADVFDDVSHGDYLYLMPKMKASRTKVRVVVQRALRRILNYPPSKQRAYVNVFLASKLHRMKTHDFAAKDRGDPEQTHEVTGQLRLGKNERDDLNSTIRDEIEGLIREGKTQEKAFGYLAKRSKSSLKYKLSAKQIEGRYRRRKIGLR